jgi:uncharacterized protein YjbI with pentapeptide repeats
VLAGTAAALALGYVIGHLLACIVLGDWSWWPWADLDPERLYDVVRSDVAAVALAGAGGAALIAYRKQRTAEEQQRTAEAQQRIASGQHELEQRRHVLAEGADLRGRYTTAAEQLGHDNAAVRIAGVYAMAELADEWARRGNFGQQQACIDVLCAYLRMPNTGAEVGPELEVRAAVLDVMRRHLLYDSDETAWCHAQFNLRGAHLDSADLSGSILLGGRMDFARAVFTQDATFEHADLAGDVSFIGAVFNGDVTFLGATFAGSDTSFEDATFNASASFIGVDFVSSRTSFFQARFNNGARTSFARSCFLERTSFLGATFRGDVDFSICSFLDEGPSFSGVDFGGDRVNFNQSVFSCKRVDFSRAALPHTRVGFYEAVFIVGRFDAQNLRVKYHGALDFTQTQCWAVQDFESVPEILLPPFPAEDDPRFSRISNEEVEELDAVKSLRVTQKHLAALRQRVTALEAAQPLIARNRGFDPYDRALRWVSPRGKTGVS